ncbi:hypothetical protein BJ170DRAFT_164642 [Xylariales sp. AK1849]|nr:hypothetical protein BJ170DRAFT_164642 [Xylariales sp. AK1849]
MPMLTSLPCEVVATILRNLGNIRSPVPSLLSCKHVYPSFKECPGIAYDNLLRQVTDPLSLSIFGGRSGGITPVDFPPSGFHQGIALRPLQRMNRRSLRTGYRRSPFHVYSKWGASMTCFTASPTILQQMPGLCFPEETRVCQASCPSREPSISASAVLLTIMKYIYSD